MSAQYHTVLADTVLTIFYDRNETYICSTYILFRNDEAKCEVDRHLLFVRVEPRTDSSTMPYQGKTAVSPQQ
jgi:hypothetical protein